MVAVTWIGKAVKRRYREIRLVLAGIRPSPALYWPGLAGTVKLGRMSGKPPFHATQTSFVEPYNDAPVDYDSDLEEENNFEDDN